MIDVHLEPIPKIDRVQLVRVLFISDAYKIKSLLTVKKIPDVLCNEARLLITPSEKSNNSIGRPAAVSFRKVFYGIAYIFGMS
jgi:hypothetical protein